MELHDRIATNLSLLVTYQALINGQSPLSFMSKLAVLVDYKKMIHPDESSSQRLQSSC